ncbi:MAG: TIGR01212 family radical SAM protein [Bdellovibrionales bacterium]
MESLPYNPISRFYRERFQAKVYKISVSVAETCPNREGINGMQTCNFCDQWGSAAYAKNLQKPLLQQIEEVRAVLTEKRGAEKFLVYFQAYTTTFSSAQKLRDQLAMALDCEGVVGLVIGTRPDCISHGFLETCHELSQKTFIALELGVQSFNNDILKWMRRGHTAEQSLKALDKITAACPDVNLGAHMIFGAPGETDEMAIEAAKILNSHKVHSTKLHHLHVLKDTPLAEDYARGEFEPLDREAYFQRCTLFLQHLRPDIAVHRLSAFSPRWDELVAPAWTSYKMKTYQDMLDFMKERGAYQGQNV